MAIPLLPDDGSDDNRAELLGPGEVMDDPGLICGPRISAPGCPLHPLAANPYCGDCRELGTPAGPGWVGVL